jgi:Fe-S cluster assembly iron-binding protein IscA
MLQCTPTAAATLDEVRKRNDLPEDYGIRVAVSHAPDGEVGLSIGFTDSPAEGDQVSHQHGTTLIVASEISEQLAGMTLDVMPDPSANGSASPQLVLRPSEQT